MIFSAQFHHLAMEKEGSWSLNWQSDDGKAPSALNSVSSSATAGGGQLPQYLLNLNWKQPMTHDADFESALTSLVSSPSSHLAAAAAEGTVIGELIGRLGSICNSAELSPSSRHRGTNTSSCYNTPRNSPPKLNLSVADHHRQQGRGGLPMPVNPVPGAHFAPFPTDPWFAEGAARLSHCGGMSSPGFAGQFGIPETPGNLSRVSSSKSLKAGAGSRMGAPENGNEVGMLAPAQLEMEMRSKFGGSSTPEASELGNGQEEESVSDRVTAEASSLRGITGSNARKRKAAAKGNGKEAPLSYSATNPPNMTEEENSDTKRCKPAETNAAGKDAEVKMKTEQNGEPSQKPGKDNDAKPPEPPKDYIHVRARRGQATDAHSLAERVRREKISKRMKLLQDLVPGCNKVTGKAVMLDEIINYVQSLQRQVEFLSMKLATLNPQLNNMESLIPKDMYQARGPMPQPVYPAEMTSTAFSYAHQPQATPLQSVVTSGLEAQFSLNPLESSLRQSQSLQLAPLDGFADATSQLGHFWEDDLQSVAQIGFGQNQESAFSSQSFGGQMQASHMKIEL